MTDIVERLRTSVTKGHEPTDADAIEAADEIERLRAERDALLPWGRGMTDIVERLRALNDGNRWPMMEEAADEIKRLRLALEDAIECLERGVYDLRLEGYLRTATILEECAGRCRRSSPATNHG